jgi:hypothetical protein
VRLPGGDGAGLEDQATRGSALWGDKWDSGGLPKRSKWAKSQGRGTFQPGYFTAVVVIRAHSDQPSLSPGRDHNAATGAQVTYFQALTEQEPVRSAFRWIGLPEGSHARGAPALGPFTGFPRPSPRTAKNPRSVHPVTPRKAQARRALRRANNSWAGRLTGFRSNL